MPSTLAPLAPPVRPQRRSRARRALALVFDAVALAGNTLAREAPARRRASRRRRFTR